MIFPELADRFKGFLESRGGTPTLGLKSTNASTFSDPAWLAYNGFRRTAEGYDYGASWSREQVNIHTALNHSVVWACNRIISETVGFLPCIMMQSAGGEKRQAESHPMYSALKNAPNEQMTAMGFSETLTSHCVLRGNAYAQIFRRKGGSGVATELYPIHPDKVRPVRDGAGQLAYVVKEGNSAEKTFTVERNKPQDIFHMRGIGDDGLVGYSVLHKARQSIGTALAAERNIANFYARGGRLPYNLKLTQKFKTDQEQDQFISDWDALAAQPHKNPVLDPNVDYQQTGLSLKDAQLLESRLFGIHEICRWFLVSPHLVGDLSRATFANIEQLALEFVKLTLATWLTRWEQELWRCVLTPEEKRQGYFWRHNLNALLRGDFASRMAGYATMLQNGIANPNEIRDLEDWNPFEGGDDHHIQLNMQTLQAGPLEAQQPEIVDT